MKKREKSAVLQFGTNLYAVTIASLLPFIVRTVLIRYIGLEYAGVSSLFSSILQVVNVADFGLTTALAYYLYKPVEKNDIQTLNSYMGFFRKLFHIVGLLILFVGIFIIPFLPIFVKGKSFPIGLNIYVIYIVYVLQSSLPYLANLYINTLLYSYLKGYINALISGTALFIMYSLQIFAVIYLKNYYIFTVLLLVAVVLQIISQTWCKKKYFPWLNFKGNVSSDFISDLKKRFFAMILSKIRNISRNSFDSIIISIFFGLTVLAKYQNYYQVLLVPYMVSIMLRQSIQSSLGNGIASETMESNYGIVKQYLFINNYISTVCMTCLLSLIQPFMKLWIGNDYLLGMDIVLCIAVYYYMLSMSECTVMFREATGIWEKGKIIAVLESVANIILNILFARFLGLWGIVFATILTLGLINIPLESYCVFSEYFKGKYRDYITRVLKYTLVSGFIAGISYMLCLKVEVTNYKMMLLRITVSAVYPTVFFIILHYKDEEMRNTFEFIKKCVGGEKTN